MSNENDEKLGESLSIADELSALFKMPGIRKPERITLNYKDISDLKKKIVKSINYHLKNFEKKYPNSYKKYEVPIYEIDLYDNKKKYKCVPCDLELTVEDMNYAEYILAGFMCTRCFSCLIEVDKIEHKGRLSEKCIELLEEVNGK